jgi:SHS2 domain-containing protein
MIVEKLAGSQEVAHTADWELHVWAPDLTGLLEQAARGMYRLQGIKLKSKPHLKRSFELTFEDRESLLVDFLSELLLMIETDGLVIDLFDLNVSGNTLKSDLSGTKLISIAKEIKAVTYHNLQVRKTENGLETNIVFDV